MEWLQSLSTQSSFTTIAYSQLQFLPAMQIASVTGFFGVTFVLSLFASTIAYTVTFHKTVCKSWTVVIVSISFVLGSLGYGFYRIEAYQGNAISRIKVGLASINASPKDIFNPIKAGSLLEGYRPLIQKLSQQGSKIILLPEEILSVNPSNNEQIKSALALLARQNEITLIVGINDLQKDKRSNNVWIFNSQGSLIGTYSKQHLVPGIEDEITPGINLLSFPLNNSNASVAICRDLDYTDPAHVYGQRDTNILFVPAWDFEVDARAHAAGAITRGIENGYTIVRTARGGYLSITSPTGQALAEALAVEKNGKVLIADSLIWQNSSFYAKHKYWFIYVLIFMLLFLIAMFLRSNKV
jgi:apolipoprotein N-acyltransferase